MTNKPKDNAVPAELATIDSAPRPAPVRAKIKPREATAAVAGASKWTLKKVACGLALNVAFMACWNAPTIKKFVGAVATGIVVLIGRDKDVEAATNKVIDKAADVAPPRPPLITRIIDPVKEAAAKPVEVVKEGAKKAVVKAEEKAEAIREEVAEQAGEVKGAIQGLRVPAEPPREQPGILATARDKLAGTRDAVAQQVRGMAPEPATPSRQERDQLSNDRARAVRKALKAKNAAQLNYIGAVTNAGVNQAVQQYNSFVDQRRAWADQMMQGNVEQLNRQLRGGR